MTCKQRSTQSIKIFRLEDQFGDGIYRSTDPRLDDVTSHIEHSNVTHPLPHEDRLLLTNAKLKNIISHVQHPTKLGWLLHNGGYFYGFSSEEQFRSWFPDDQYLEYLHNNGCKLCIYHINPRDAINGDTQVAFKLEKNRQVEYHSIAKYLTTVL